MTPDTEQPIRTHSVKAGSMWCETCETSTTAVYTTTRFYTGGREVERQMCSECKNVQETEYFKGPTTRIKNRK